MLLYDHLKPYREPHDSLVACPVRACQRWVSRAARNSRLRSPDHRCPDHALYVSPSTFEHQDLWENLLWHGPEDAGAFNAILPFKRERHRLGRERSEDAVTWNVFRYLERERLLADFVQSVTGVGPSAAPRIMYWSYCPHERCRWPALEDTCSRFGERAGRGSEPDVILDTPEALVFVEAKVGSGNVSKPSSGTSESGYVAGCGGWYRRVFNDDATFQEVAVEQRKYELLRLWLIGTCLAHAAGKRFVLLNLVRASDDRERDIEERFGRFLAVDERRRFVRWTWEQVFTGIVTRQAPSRDRDLLLDYARNKTLGYDGQGKLRRAFKC